MYASPQKRETRQELQASFGLWGHERLKIPNINKADQSVHQMNLTYKENESHLVQVTHADKAGSHVVTIAVFSSYSSEKIVSIFDSKKINALQGSRISRTTDQKEAFVEIEVKLDKAVKGNQVFQNAFDIVVNSGLLEPLERELINEELKQLINQKNKQKSIATIDKIKEGVTRKEPTAERAFDIIYNMSLLEPKEFGDICKQLRSQPWRGETPPTLPVNITTKPSSKIIFNTPLGLNRRCYVKIVNNSDLIDWSVETTNTRCITVDPASGRLDSGEGALVVVLCTPLPNEAEFERLKKERQEKKSLEYITIKCVNQSRFVEYKQLFIEYNL